MEGGKVIQWRGVSKLGEFRRHKPHGGYSRTQISYLYFGGEYKLIC